MTGTVVVAKSAQRQLARFPAKDQDRIAAALVAMEAEPFSGDIVKLEGETDRWRRRVGNYRIFFTADKVTRRVSVSANAVYLSPVPQTSLV